MYLAHIARDQQTGEERFQTCTEHARNVAALCRSALSPFGLGAAGYLAGLLHDCGKFTDEFNDYLYKAARSEPVRKGSVIHTFAGVSYLLKAFHTMRGTQALSDVAAEIIAVSIGSHHGLMDVWDDRGLNGFEHRRTHQPDYDARATEAFRRECAAQEEVRELYRQAEQEIAVFFQQKIVPACLAPGDDRFLLGLLTRLVTSALIDSDRTDTRCFMLNLPLPEPVPPPWAACADSILRHISTFPQATPIQQARRVFSDLCAEAALQPPGLFRLDLPTGGGKTLAALRFAVLHAKAHRMRRVIYTAPLLSIIEQNADAIRSAVGDAMPVLEHHSNVLRSSDSPEEAGQTEYLQETWDAPLIITTFVQLLHALFKGETAAVRRFHALCGSVVIIDEVQSLPRRMLSLFNCAVNFLVACCGATVVLCSATQPAFDQAVHQMLPRRRIIGEEVFRRYAPLFRRTEITDAGHCSIPELAAMAEEILGSSDSLLIVCNTKREAAELYRELAVLEGVKRFHLSAGMCMAHRKDVLEKLNNALEARERLVCVSTQLIEAGVDVSFGAVIRLSAGLDNIVQTAGRCNRHGEHDTPQPVRICRLKNEQLGSLQEIVEAQRALDALLGAYRRKPARFDNDLASDAAVRMYYMFLFNDMKHEAQDYATHDQTLYELLSANRHFTPENGGGRYVLTQAFRTAGAWFEVFDESSETVLVPWGDGESCIHQLADADPYDLENTARLLAQAKLYTVSMPARQLQQRLGRGEVWPLLGGSAYALNKDWYDKETGIKEGDASCGTLIL